MKQSLVSLLCALLATACPGRTVTVDDDGSADYSSIQAAIEDSAPEDRYTIVVRVGTYRENVSFQGRAVTVTSENPDDPAIVRSTVISAVTGHSVTFSFREDNDSVLTGLTISGRGIYCSGASPTICKNIIRDCTDEGILGENNATPVIEDNEISSNGGAGVSGCDGPIERNFVAQNNGGIAYCNGPIRNNRISGNVSTDPGYGGGLNRCDGDIVGNTITDNHASVEGGGLYRCYGRIGNNVVAGNTAGISGGGLSHCTRSVHNNTIVGNRAGVNGGGVYNCIDSVYNNIIAFNRASSGAGIYGSCDSSYNCFSANEPDHFGGSAAAGPGDFVDDPRFIINGYWDPNGTPDRSDDFWIDGAYFLKSEVGRWDTISRTWVLDDLTSYCVDAGDPDSDWTGELWPHGKRTNVGAYGGTAWASMSLSQAGILTDLDNNNWVDYNDFALLADKWLCDEVPLAEDLDRDGIVNFDDYSILVGYWQIVPPPDIPPEPNKMTWAIEPYPTPCYSITMVATTAISTDGSGVEYYFEDYFSSSFNSGWIDFLPGQEASWQDVELEPETVYWYRVKARNKGNHLETEWSERRPAKTNPLTRPTPNPMTWETEPEPNSTPPTSIYMVATTAHHDCGVEYYFECTSDPCNSSGWQESPSYNTKSLTKSVHSFVVRARDKSRKTTTADSNEVSVDLEPPTPDPMKWAPADPAQGLPDGKPREVYHGGGTWDYWAEMRCVEAYDPCGVEYYFQCTTKGMDGFSSGWQESPEYKRQVGRTGQRLIFRVKARDKSPYRNETGWSERWPALPP
jgi:parallel beta-helix repeat protein